MKIVGVMIIVQPESSTHVNYIFVIINSPYIVFIIYSCIIVASNVIHMLLYNTLSLTLLNVECKKLPS